MKKQRYNKVKVKQLAGGSSGTWPSARWVWLKVESFSVPCPLSSLLLTLLKWKRSHWEKFPSLQRLCNPSPGCQLVPFQRFPPSGLLSSYLGSLSHVLLFSGSYKEPWRLSQPELSGFLLLAISHNFLTWCCCQDRGSSSKCDWLACVWGFDTVLVTYKGKHTAGQGQLLVIFHRCKQRSGASYFKTVSYLTWHTSEASSWVSTAFGPA